MMTGDLLVSRTMQWFPVKTKGVGGEVTYKPGVCFCLTDNNRRKAIKEQTDNRSPAT